MIVPLRRHNDKLAHSCSGENVMIHDKTATTSGSNDDKFDFHKKIKRKMKQQRRCCFVTNAVLMLFLISQNYLYLLSFDMGTETERRMMMEMLSVNQAFRNDLFIKMGLTEEESLVQQQHDIPIVLISSARPQYLQQTLASLEHQNPNTPAWLLHSPRHLFVHWNEFNSNDASRLDAVQELAKRYNVTLHMFHGLGTVAQRNPNVTLAFRQSEAKQRIAYFAKLTWYNQMRYLFGNLKVQEALMIEEDATLAYDGLLTAAVLFQEKWRREGLWQKHNSTRTTIDEENRPSSSLPPKAHAICLGAWSGENRINAHPNTILAVRSRFFQAMVYSLDASLFQQIETKHLALPEWDLFEVTDWTEEITVSGLVKNLIMLTPSVGRMHHIGQQGMGENGNGKARQAVPIHWEPWNASIHNTSRTIHDYYLDPADDTIVTDIFGFVCFPLHAICHGMLSLVQPPRFGNDTTFRLSRNSSDYYHLLSKRKLSRTLSNRQKDDEALLSHQRWQQEFL